MVHEAWMLILWSIMKLTWHENWIRKIQENYIIKSNLYKYKYINKILERKQPCIKNMHHNKVIYSRTIRMAYYQKKEIDIIHYKSKLRECYGLNIYIPLKKLPRGRQWHPTPALLPGKSNGRRSLVGCSPWGR